MMYYHLTPVENLDSILRNGLQPKTYPGPELFLFSSSSDAQNALMNWYGEEHGDEEIALLHIDVDPEEFDLKRENSVGYEVHTVQTIPVSCIKIVEFLE